MNDMNIMVGDCREVLDALTEHSVQCVVTSPPYWGQRDYGTAQKGIGLEADVTEWVDSIVQVFQKVRRVLRDDGTVWLNLGDKYAGSGGAGGDYNPGGLKDGVTGGPVASTRQSGLKQKDLMGLPWRVAFALQADGWYLRRDIIWHKPNPMPESATDRPSTAHEYIFLLTKQPHYFYDSDAIREPQITVPNPKDVNRSDYRPGDNQGFHGNGMFTKHREYHPLGRTKRSVWTIPTQAFSGAHFATYPEKLVEPCIKAGTKEGDTVLDPFSGAGTTGLVALKLDRNYIGIELNPEYAAMSHKRIVESVGVQTPESLAPDEQAQGRML